MRRCLYLLLATGVLLGGCAPAGDGGSYRTARPSLGYPSPWGDPYGRPYYRPYGYVGPGHYPLPRRYRDDDDDRYFHRGGDVFCDRDTKTCYRDGEIDASETRDTFGRKAARRVDRLRDAAGTNHIFRPDDDVTCNLHAQVCSKDGRPDRRATRDHFGKKEARKQGKKAGKNRD